MYYSPIRTITILAFLALFLASDLHAQKRNKARSDRRAKRHQTELKSSTIGAGNHTVDGPPIPMQNTLTPPLKKTKKVVIVPAPPPPPGPDVPPPYPKR